MSSVGQWEPHGSDVWRLGERRRLNSDEERGSADEDPARAGRPVASDSVRRPRRSGAVAEIDAAMGGTITSR